jgi:hypothetical protein
MARTGAKRWQRGANKGLYLQKLGTLMGRIEKMNWILNPLSCNLINPGHPDSNFLIVFRRK